MKKLIFLILMTLPFLSFGQWATSSAIITVAQLQDSLVCNDGNSNTLKDIYLDCDCTGCPNELVIEGDIFSGTQTAIDTIYINNAQIVGGNNVTFKHENGLLIDSNFVVPLGASLNVIYEICNE